jgi:hypothetical protein
MSNFFFSKMQAQSGASETTTCPELAIYAKPILDAPDPATSWFFVILVCNTEAENCSANFACAAKFQLFCKFPF